MKIFGKNSAVIVLAVCLALGLVGPAVALAATSPTLTGAATYSVLAGSIVTNTGATTVSGDLGVSPSIGIPPHFTGFPPGIVGPPGGSHDADASAAAAQADDTATFGFLDQGCTTSYAGIQDLTLVSPLGSGVYCAPALILTGNLTLTGSGPWIFKSASTLITSPGSSVIGGDPCNVWWRVVSSATLDTTTSFIGNIFALTDINMRTGATLNGRALVQTGQVSLQSNTITGPICGLGATLTVTKIVVGGSKAVSGFSFFIDGSSVSSGIARTTSAGLHTVSETADPGYTSAITGDCASNGTITLAPGDSKFCIITNNSIPSGGAGGVPPPTPAVPPLIDVVKVPSPLALPDGPGQVEYTYTARNIGTVPMTNVTMVGDSCSPITLVSGDTNSNAALDLDETWVYICSKMVSATHTNTVVATGWANGISAVDIASASVVVGPVVPPLIHVTKVPSPLTLPASGGMVTYSETVTNPGTVALSNVRLADDKCSPVNYISGDTNGDLKLDPTETWIYDCRTNLSQNTTNTVTASGEANGLTARDFAIATVVVSGASTVAPNMSVPPAVYPSVAGFGLPGAGFPPQEKTIPWNSMVLLGIFTVLSLLYLIRKKHTV